MGLLTELCLEHLMEILKAMSLGWSSVELMVIKMVLMMESDWAGLMVMH